MSRLRARPDDSKRPGPITKEGYAKLEAEAHRLWSLERPQLVKAVATAAAEGDRSENAEYIYGKKKLAEIDRRLTYLGKRLQVLTITETRAPSDGRIAFGAWVRLQDEDGQALCYRIVGADESDATNKHISIDAPLAQALLGKRIGDEVEVVRPRGETSYVVLDVRYE